MSKRSTVLISVALLSLAHANLAPAKPASTVRGELDKALSELRLKWRAYPKLLRQLNASQRSWERSATETCSFLVREVYIHGSIEPVKEDDCMAQAETQRAVLLTSTFQSALRN